MAVIPQAKMRVLAASCHNCDSTWHPDKTCHDEASLNALEISVAKLLTKRNRGSNLAPQALQTSWREMSTFAVTLFRHQQIGSLS